MNARFPLSVISIFLGLSLFAAKKPDAKSVYLQQLSSSPAIETLDDFTSVAKEKVYIRMFHNDDHIKVQVVVPDRGMQAKFLMQGLQVFLDISGKKGRKFCVSFPKLERERMRGAMQMQRKPMIEQVGANSAVLINGRNETLLDVGKVYMTAIGEDDQLLFSIQLPLSALGGKIGKEAIVSVGLLAEMDPNQMPPTGSGGNMGQGRAMSGNSRSGSVVVGDQGGRPMRMEGAGGDMRSDFITPFNTWITFDLK